jgi:hypothetical protein
VDSSDCYIPPVRCVGCSPDIVSEGKNFLTACSIGRARSRVRPVGAADLFIRSGWPPLITARYFSSNPSDSGSLRTPCLPTAFTAGWRGITPPLDTALLIRAPEGLEPSDSCAAQRTLRTLSATPRRPACPSRASGWSLLTTPWGFPCCVRFPCVHACRHYPGAAAGHTLRLLRPAVSAFPERLSVGLRIVLFEDCSAFTRVTACTLALSPIRDTLIEALQPLRYLHDCSDCFRLERLPGGVRTHRKAPPCHGAHPFQTFRFARRNSTVCCRRRSLCPPSP